MIKSFAVALAVCAASANASFFGWGKKAPAKDDHAKKAPAKAVHGKVSQKASGLGSHLIGDGRRGSFGGARGFGGARFGGARFGGAGFGGARGGRFGGGRVIGDAGPGIESYAVPAQTAVPRKPGNPFHPGAPTYDESYEVPA